MVVFVDDRRSLRAIADLVHIHDEGHTTLRNSAVATLLITATMTTVHAQTLDSALAFFPLSIGDTWEYASYWGMTAANQFEGYGFSGVTGDTLMPNGRVYRVFRQGANPNQLLANPLYYRVDSTTANVYSYSPTKEQETLWDSLREGLRHSNQWGMVDAVINEVILGTNWRERLVLRAQLTH